MGQEFGIERVLFSVYGPRSIDQSGLSGLWLDAGKQSVFRAKEAERIGLNEICEPIAYHLILLWIGYKMNCCNCCISTLTHSSHLRFLLDCRQWPMHGRGRREYLSSVIWISTGHTGTLELFKQVCLQVHSTIGHTYYMTRPRTVAVQFRRQNYSVRFKKTLWFTLIPDRR